ncbi:hypothetical protein [Leptospira santarosai]|uniref:hypothetical protein n=1 Tax=Leptospira santarosai TaxID=28183 RepID=UPI0009688779|nr:hypothetical protein BWD11_17560 [Leptospira santarosai serovar Grippotyphosa]ONF77177.1 hypothetical protein BWD12_16620 [Leptospira santarosai serovar Bananal]
MEYNADIFIFSRVRSSQYQRSVWNQIFSDDQDVRKNKKTAPTSLSEILSKVSPKEMTEFLLAKAEYDLGFQEELRNYFILSKDDSELYYKKMAERIFRSLAGFSEDYFNIIVSMELPSDSLEFLLKILKKKIKTEKNDSYQIEETALQTYSVLKKRRIERRLRSEKPFPKR